VSSPTTCPVVAEFDPLGNDYLGDPFAILAGLPGDCPVFYAPSIDYYVVTRHSDIAGVFRDHETYSAAAAQLPLVPLVPEAGRILLDGGPPAPAIDGQPGRCRALAAAPPGDARVHRQARAGHGTGHPRQGGVTARCRR